MRRLAAAILPLLVSCVLDPHSNATVQPGRAGTIRFSGIAQPLPGVTVTVEYENPRSGWTQIGSGPLPAHGSWIVDATVPEAAWWQAPCNSARFRVRANGGPYFAQDQLCLDDPLAAPGGLCVTGDFIDLFRPVTHVGDLDIVGQAEADANRCITNLQGNLTFTGDAIPVGPSGFQAGVVTQLPRLASVSGDLIVDGGRTEAISLPQLTTVGGTFTATLTRFTGFTGMVSANLATKLHAPRLQSVGGGLTLQTAGTGGPNTQTFEFGLPALAVVGGDVAVHNAVFPGNLTGLTTLTTVPGNLLYDWGVSDLNNGDNLGTIDPEGILNALVTVQGDVTLQLPPNGNSGLSHLAHVGGSLTLQPNSNSGNVRTKLLPELADVGGDLTLLDTSFSDCTATTYWPSLTTVGGAVRAQTESVFLKSFGATGGSHLTVGSLEVTATSAGRIPLFADARILGSGGAAFTNNASLCPCLIDAFIAVQTLAGWTGVVTTSGNGGGAACAPCPMPASCP